MRPCWRCIHSMLEILKHRDRDGINKGEGLHHDDGGNVICRINPEIGIVYPRPGHPSGSRAAFDGLAGESETISELVESAGNASIRGVLRDHALEFAERQIADMV